MTILSSESSLFQLVNPKSKFLTGFGGWGGGEWLSCSKLNLGIPNCFRHQTFHVLNSMY